LGKSLRYSTTSSRSSSANELWQHYREANIKNNILTPGSYILSPTDNNGALGITNFYFTGNSIGDDANAFRTIQKYSKIPLGGRFNRGNLSFAFLHGLYQSFFSQQFLSNSILSYNMRRAPHLTSPESFIINFSPLIDPLSSAKYF